MSDKPSAKEKWWAWHRENPDVWRLFEAFTNEAVARGRTRISAWLIVNRIRWETEVVTNGVDFKISNNFIAYYARLYLAVHPESAGLFVIKKMKEETRHE